jgi:hypothetical protein
MACPGLDLSGHRKNVVLNIEKHEPLIHMNQIWQQAQNTAIINDSSTNRFIILSLIGTQPVFLSEVGATIWNLIDGQRSETTIADLMVDNYEVDRKIVTDSLRSFLDLLASNDLIRPLAPK